MRCLHISCAAGKNGGGKMMNVTFHALGSLAAAAILSIEPNRKVWSLPRFAAGFVIGILIHGVLDFLPHDYPLPSRFDAALALFLLALSLVTAAKQNRWLLLFCFAGAIFSDLVDLSAGIANKHLGIPVPQLPFKIFPWHRKEYSGSIYDGGRQFESNFYHISASSIFLYLIYAYRINLFRDWRTKS